MDDLPHMGNLNPYGEIQQANGKEEQNEQNNLGQSGNNSIIYMAYDRGRAIRDYAVLTPQVTQLRIIIS